MRTQTFHSTSYAMASGRRADWRLQMRRWWLGLPEPLRKPWPVAFAWLTILALLVGFHHVVTLSVKQGEVLRMTAHTRSDAVWRCNALAGAKARAQCLEQIDAPPTPVAVDNVAPPNTAALNVAQLGR